MPSNASLIPNGLRVVEATDNRLFAITGDNGFHIFGEEVKRTKWGFAYTAARRRRLLSPAHVLRTVRAA